MAVCIQIYAIKTDKTTKISFKHLDRRDRRRVKKSPNLINNSSFISSRLLKSKLKFRLKKGKFSLSHKDNMTVLVVSKFKIGIDIERLKTRKIEPVMEFCFNKDEKEFVLNYEEQGMPNSDILENRDIKNLKPINSKKIKAEILEFTDLKTLNFYKVYTAKEAMIKYLNLGFHNLKEVNFFNHKFRKIYLLKDDFIISIVY